MTSPARATTYLDLAEEITILEGQTVSKTVYRDDAVKVVLFGFAVGQELSEHTATVPAVLQFLTGEATVNLGTDTITAKANTFVHMPTRLPHSIVARKDTRMLLVILKGAES